MTPIDNWRDVWRFYSTHSFTVSLSIGTGLGWLAKEYPAYYAAIPGWVLSILAVAMLVSFVVSRVVKQEGTHAAQ
jgi:hypothetical protein